VFPLFSHRFNLIVCFSSFGIMGILEEGVGYHLSLDCLHTQFLPLFFRTPFPFFPYFFEEPLQHEARFGGASGTLFKETYTMSFGPCPPLPPRSECFLYLNTSPSTRNLRPSPGILSFLDRPKSSSSCSISLWFNYPPNRLLDLRSITSQRWFNAQKHILAPFLLPSLFPLSNALPFVLLSSALRILKQPGFICQDAPYGARVNPFPSFFSVPFNPLPLCPFPPECSYKSSPPIFTLLLLPL